MEKKALSNVEQVTLYPSYTPISSIFRKEKKKIAYNSD